MGLLSSATRVPPTPMTPPRLPVLALVVAFSVAALPGCRCDGERSGTSESAGESGASDDGAFGFGGGDWAWESRGVGGGGAFLSAAINPHDPNDLSIATDMGMVFRSLDFGRSWVGLHHSTIRGTDRSTHRFTADPEVIYAIDWRGWQGSMPVRSLDGGREWAPLLADPTDDEAMWIDPDPDSTERLLAGDWASVHLTVDGGATYREIHRARIQEEGVHVAGIVWDDERIIIGLREQLLVSTDGGDTFAPVPHEGLPDGEVVGCLAGARDGDTLRLWAVTRAPESTWPGVGSDQVFGYRGLWTADWGHGPWVRSSRGIDDEFLGYTVTAARHDIDRVYIAGADTETQMPAVYRSVDGGRTWTSTFLTDGNDNIATGWTGSRGDIDFWWSLAPLTFAVSPSDPRYLIMGDLGFVHVSADGGDTWQQAYVHVDDQTPAGRHTPRRRTYRSVGLENTSSWWLHGASPTEIFAAFSDIRGIRSDDGGERWSVGFHAGLSLNSTYHVVEHEQAGVLYAATSSVHDAYQSTFLTDEVLDPAMGQVLMSTDLGATWTPMTEMGHPVVWLALDPDAPDRMYASVIDTERGGIWVTNDLSAGVEAHWRRLPPPERTEGHPYNVRLLSDGTLVTSWSGRRDDAEQFTTSSGIFVSVDGGESWEDRSHPDMHRWTKDVVIDPHDRSESTWYVGVFSHWGAPPNEVGGLFRTRDRGETWMRISDLYRVESITIDPTYPNVAFVSTETRGLWQTSDLTAEAPRFTEVESYPFEHPMRVFFNPDDPDEIWSTSFGGGLRVWHR